MSSIEREVSEQVTVEVSVEDPSRKYTIYKVTEYNKRKGKNGDFPGVLSVKGTITAISELLKEDEYYHLRLGKDDNVMMFGDLDGYVGSIEEFKSKLGSYLRSKNYEVDMEDNFRYTENEGYVSKKKDGGKSYHFTVLTLYGSMEVMSKMMKEFMRMYKCEEIDTSVYGEKWFRLPHQRKGKKTPEENTEGTQHKIVKGEMRDFVVTHIQGGSRRVYWEEGVKVEKKESVLEKEVPEVVVSSISSMEEIEERKSTIRRCYEVMDKRRFEEYDSWFKIGCICYNECVNEGLELFDEGSKKASNYDRLSVEAKYEEIRKSTRKDRKIGLGTMIRWAKEDSPGFQVQSSKEYDSKKKSEDYFWLPPMDINKIGEVYMNAMYQMSDADYVDLILHLYPGYFYSDQRSLYFFNQYGIYKADNGEIDTVLSRIREHLREGLSRMKGEVDRMKEENDLSDDEVADLKERMKELMNMTTRTIAHLGNLKHINPIKKMLLQSVKIRDNTLYERMDEANPYVVGFENGIWDLKEGVFRKGRREDYVSITTGYDYTPYVKEDVDKVYKVIRSIWKTDEQAKYCLHMLAYSLDGTIDRGEVNFHIGSGGNGKSLLFNALRHCLGGYYGSMGPEYFLDSKNESGKANSDLAQTKGKRVVVISEIETSSNDKIQTRKLKDISGGEVVKVRDLYKSSFELKPQFTLHFMSNNLPLLSSTDDGVARRLRVITYPYLFRDVSKYRAGVEGEFLRDETLGSMLREHRMSFFHLLVKYYKPDYVVTEEVKRGTDSYFLDSNPILKWFSETYKKGQGEEIIAVKDLVDEYNDEMKMKITSHVLTAALKKGSIETGKYGKCNVTGYKGYKLISDVVNSVGISVVKVSEVSEEV